MCFSVVCVCALFVRERQSARGVWQSECNGIVCVYQCSVRVVCGVCVCVCVSTWRLTVLI